MSAVDSLQTLVSEISARANEASWRMSRDSALEDVAELQSNLLLRAVEGKASPDEFRLPDHRFAFVLRDSARVLLAAFDDASDLLGACRDALWWAGLVRGSLHPISRADLFLFIVATPSSGGEERILSDRSRLEADERICRKHVWLPSIDTSAADFLDATFLACPWRHSDALAPQSLDPLQRLVETAGLPCGAAWVGALSKLDDVKADAIAEVLSALYEDSDGV